MPRIRHIALACWLLLVSTWVSAQVTRVQGKVTDAVTGEALPYATIYFAGTLTGTSADAAGLYNLEVSETEVRAITAEIGGYIPVPFPSFPGKTRPWTSS